VQPVHPCWTSILVQPDDSTSLYPDTTLMMIPPGRGSGDLLWGACGRKGSLGIKSSYLTFTAQVEGSYLSIRLIHCPSIADRTRTDESSNMHSIWKHTYLTRSQELRWSCCSMIGYGHAPAVVTGHLWQQSLGLLEVLLRGIPLSGLTVLHESTCGFDLGS